MMNLKRGQELQERIAKETIALLMLTEASVDSEKYETAVSLAGKVWSIPEAETQRWLNAIAAERDGVRKGVHVYPEEELPINASGTETLNTIWDLFETAVHLSGEPDRVTLFELAEELAETQNLLDWIEKTPAERDEWKMNAPAM